MNCNNRVVSQILFLFLFISSFFYNSGEKLPLDILSSIRPDCFSFPPAVVAAAAAVVAAASVKTKSKQQTTKHILHYFFQNEERKGFFFQENLSCLANINCLAY